MRLSAKPALRWASALAVLATSGALLALTPVNPAQAADSDTAAGADIVTRRLSVDQYRQAIADTFGPTIAVGGRFEPDVRENGLLAVGASRISVTATGLEQYESLARGIAAQVVSERHRATLIPCTPASATQPDDACASQFLAAAGRLLYRRPLTQDELRVRVGVAASATKSLKDFYAGLGTELSAMLVSPQFLFRHEVAEQDPAHPGQYRLDAFSKASQLSFFLWNAAPDRELLAAAESGDLNTQKGLTHEVERMLASPRLEAGVRAYFADMLGFDGLDTLAKDPLIFPKFTPDVIRDAREQTLRTIADLLVTQNGDYRDLFTTRKTFLTPLLGSIYGVPVDAPDGGWQMHEFPAGDPRAGVLAEISFVALHAHPGRSSPTLRGKALRELVLCQKVPDPPANVNFTVVQDTANPKYKTTRERLTAHRTDAVCAGCHKIMDPMGLAMENFDAIGAFRMTENGAAIDVSGDIDGAKFADAPGLAQAIHDHPAASACVVTRAYAYGTGRPATKGETQFLNSLEKDFATSGHRYKDLLKKIAVSDEFYRVAPSQTGALEMPASKLAAQTSSPQEERK